MGVQWGSSCRLGLAQTRDRQQGRFWMRSMRLFCGYMGHCRLGHQHPQSPGILSQWPTLPSTTPIEAQLTTTPLAQGILADTKESMNLECPQKVNR